MGLWEETAEYALHALTVRRRQDVYEEIVRVMRAWDTYESDEVRRAILRRIEHASVGNPRFERDAENLSGWQAERAKAVDATTEAYLRERLS